MIRRTLRFLFRLGVLGGLVFGLVKLVQNVRSSSSRGMPSGDPILPPRPNQPLVEPAMLNIDLHKEAAEDEKVNGQAPAPSVLRVETATEAEGAPAAQPAPPAGDATAAAAEAAASATATAEPAAQAAPAPGKKAAAKKSPAKAWVDPKGGFCPTSHPVKAKLASGIFHLPGMTAYERTTPDRCYADAEAAEGDGLRKAKR